MDTFKNIGLIVGSQTGNAFQVSPLSKMKGYKLRKVLVAGGASTDQTQKRFPHAEIVYDKASLVQDSQLDLIVIDAPVKECLDLVGDVLRTGKAVRII